MQSLVSAKDFLPKGSNVGLCSGLPLFRKEVDIVLNSSEEVVHADVDCDGPSHSNRFRFPLTLTLIEPGSEADRTNLRSGDIVIALKQDSGQIVETTPSRLPSRRSEFGQAKVSKMLSLGGECTVRVQSSRLVCTRCSTFAGEWRDHSTHSPSVGEWVDSVNHDPRCTRCGRVASQQSLMRIKAEVGTEAAVSHDCSEQSNASIAPSSCTGQLRAHSCSVLEYHQHQHRHADRQQGGAPKSDSRSANQLKAERDVQQCIDALCARLNLRERVPSHSKDVLACFMATRLRAGVKRMTLPRDAVASGCVYAACASLGLHCTVHDMLGAAAGCTPKRIKAAIAAVSKAVASLFVKRVLSNAVAPWQPPAESALPCHPAARTAGLPLLPRAARGSLSTRRGPGPVRLSLPVSEPALPVGGPQWVRAARIPAEHSTAADSVALACSRAVLPRRSASAFKKVGARAMPATRVSRGRAGCVLSSGAPVQVTGQAPGHGFPDSDHDAAAQAASEQPAQAVDLKFSSGGIMAMENSDFSFSCKVTGIKDEVKPEVEHPPDCCSGGREYTDRVRRGPVRDATSDTDSVSAHWQGAASCCWPLAEPDSAFPVDDGLEFKMTVTKRSGGCQGGHGARASDYRDSQLEDSESSSESDLCHDHGTSTRQLWPGGLKLDNDERLNAEDWIDDLDLTPPALGLLQGPAPWQVRVAKRPQAIQLGNKSRRSQVSEPESCWQPECQSFEGLGLLNLKAAHEDWADEDWADELDLDGGFDASVPLNTEQAFKNSRDTVMREDDSALHASLEEADNWMMLDGEQEEEEREEPEEEGRMGGQNMAENHHLEENGALPRLHTPLLAGSKATVTLTPDHSSVGSQALPLPGSTAAAPPRPEAQPPFHDRTTDSPHEREGASPHDEESEKRGGRALPASSLPAPPSADDINRRLSSQLNIAFAINNNAFLRLLAFHALLRGVERDGLVRVECAREEEDNCVLGFRRINVVDVAGFNRRIRNMIEADPEGIWRKVNGKGATELKMPTAPLYEVLRKIGVRPGGGRESGAARKEDRFWRREWEYKAALMTAKTAGRMQRGHEYSPTTSSASRKTKSAP